MLVWNQYFRVKGLARSAREATVEESGETAKTQGQGQLERRPVEHSGKTGKQEDRVSSRGDLWNSRARLRKHKDKVSSRGDLGNSHAAGKRKDKVSSRGDLGHSWARLVNKSTRSTREATGGTAREATCGRVWRLVRTHGCDNSESEDWRRVRRQRKKKKTSVRPHRRSPSQDSGGDGMSRAC